MVDGRGLRSFRGRLGDDECADLEFERLVAKPYHAGDGIGARRGGDGLAVAVEDLFYLAFTGCVYSKFAVFAADVQPGQVFRLAVAVQTHVDVLLQRFNIAAADTVDRHVRPDHVMTFAALMVGLRPSPM